mmetsp:Transcript_39853/g.29406  ORF Transcript_39853/g.29406 Transcript_39853/m.29406 type:complete len:106 (+) Transcript_39853:981-1298(+)
MDVLGAPSEHDLSFVTDPTAIAYLQEYKASEKKGVDLDLRFPYASKEAMDLLRKMVQFNPFYRISIEECLAHPFFSNIRKQNLEVKAKKRIEIDLDTIEGDISVL